MSGLTIGDIREALRAQLDANTSADISVHAYPVGDYTTPAVTVGFPTDDYVDYFVSFGSAGLARVRFTLLLEPGGLNREGAGEELDKFLSAGTGNDYSVVDALMVNPSLGLAGCNAHIQTAIVDPVSLTAELGVEVHINKVGAEA